MNKPGSQRISLIGKRVHLRSFDESDISSEYLGWLNDPEVVKYLDVGRAPSTRATVKRYLKRFSDSDADFIFAVCDRETGKHIGTVTLTHIDGVHRTADTGIMIGDKDYWGKGYGLEAWGLLLEFAFAQLKLHKIIAGAVDTNIQSLKVQEKLGFKIEGRLRQELFIEGRFHDALRTGLLATEFVRPEIRDA